MTSVDDLSGIPDDVMQRHKSNWANVDGTLNEKLAKKECKFPNTFQFECLSDLYEVPTENHLTCSFYIFASSPSLIFHFSTI